MGDSQSATANVVGTVNAAGRTMAELSPSILADEVRKLAEQSSKQTTEIAASVREIQRVTQVASTDTAMSAARDGLDSLAQHGENVVSISRHIADGTRQQAAAGNGIASQVHGIVDSIEQTTSAIGAVTNKAVQVKDGSSRLRELISYSRFIR